MLQLLLIAFIVFKDCTYGEVSLSVKQWIKPVFQDMNVACMFVELSVELKNNGSWLAVGTEVFCDQAWGDAGLLPRSGQHRGWPSTACSLCWKAVGHSWFVTFLLLNPRHFSFWAGLHLVKHNSMMMWKGGMELSIRNSFSWRSACKRDVQWCAMACTVTFSQ